MAQRKALAAMGLQLISGVAALLAPNPAVLVVAVAWHFAGVALAGATQPRGSRRVLTLAVAAAVPGIGAAITTELMQTRGKGELDPFARPPRKRMLTIADARRIASCVPACETLLMGNDGERRLTLQRLATRGDARSVGLLRWALANRDGDLALAAALILEDLNNAFEERLKTLTDKLEAEPTFRHAMAAADCITEALTARIIDSAVAHRFGDQAAELYDRAARLQHEEAQAIMLAERRTALELVALRPRVALRIARETGDITPTMTTLGREAAHAARVSA